MDMKNLVAVEGATNLIQKHFKTLEENIKNCRFIKPRYVLINLFDHYKRSLECSRFS